MGGWGFLTINLVCGNQLKMENKGVMGGAAGI
jgi:hypothetical protein